MVVTVPKTWMPPAAMQRIHVHWTAGGHRANAIDRAAYHLLIEGDGKLVRGDKSIAANAPGSGMTPAAHTLNANTGAIGVSMCAMVGAREQPFDPGPAPLTETQWQAMVSAVAQLALHYGIPITPQTVLTHAEVQPNLGIAQRSKWDITVLPFDRGTVGHRPVGDRLRREVAAALDALRPPPPGLDALPDELRLPRYRVQGVAPSTLNLRRTPNGELVGALPEGTRLERLAMDGGWWQVRTPRGHVGWVWHSFLRAVA
jgi:hypothetical protein